MANFNFNGIIRGGVIRNMQILGFGANPNPNPPGPTPLQVSTSVRLNPADTPNLSFIPTLTGNTQTLTFSAWVKRSLLSSQQILFGANTDTNNHVFLEFQANDTIRIASNTAASTVIQLITTQVFRDPSQWYHLVLAFDLTNSTQADRVKFYINGSRVTAFTTSTLPANTTTFTTFNTAGVQQYIGRYAASSSFYFGGYIADINLVDGQALTPAAFTETDTATGQLIPMTYAGSYGVNGFYLPFGNSATVAELGLDPKITGQDYPYWPYTTLLINSSSANGAQNNTFLDSSTNAFTITRNGNTTQGNFTPFNYGGGTTQENGYYSGYFDGTGDYANVSGSGELVNFGTNNFTIEAWFIVSTLSTAFNIFDTCPLSNSSPTNRIIIRVNTSGALQYATFQAVTVLITSSNSVISTNTWNHVALVKSSGSTKLYLNGIQVGSTYTDSLNYPAQANRPILMGDGFNATALGTGYISNLRVVKGTAVYTANFTVPTTPLTAITNTSLLTCQSSQFIDNSANALSITTAGNTQPVPINPFGMTDWSGYFDGTGDNLLIASTSALDLPADFTIECWVNFSALGSNRIILDRWSSGVNGGWQLYWRGTGTSITFYFNTAVVVQDASTTRIQTGIWYHIAAVRSGTTCSLYINGEFVGSGALSLALSPANLPLCIGEQYTTLTNDLNGFVSNVRIVRSALYTTNFTPSTAPLTAVANTCLLTCQSSTFIDNSPNALAIAVNGNTYPLTLNNPFNSPVNSTPPVQAWSNYFNGSSQFIVTTTNTAFDIAGDFTVEGWFNVSGGYQFFGIEQAASPEYAAIQLQLDGSNRLLMLFSQSGSSWALQVTATQTYAFNQWNHLAITRSGTTIRLFQNGSVIASGTLSGALYSSGVRTCINGRNGSGYITGSYSNFRFINGQALYISDFTPSTQPLTLTSQGAQASAVKLLTCQSNRFVDNSLFNFTLTPGGNTAAQASSPFTPTTAYSAASYGGTMYFDGSGDYLDTPSNAALALGTGDFTIQFWVWFYSHKNFIELIDARGGVNTAIRPVLYTDSAGILYYYNDGANRITSGALRTNSWIHIALTRSGTSTKLFVNGAQSGSTYVDASNYTQAVWRVGSANNATPADATNYSLPGYISGLQVLKGTALYTTPFVPPVLPPTNISNTSLLLNATNSGIYDATGDNVIETVGNAQVSTAVKKWGESSVYFDGSGDYLSIQPWVDLYLSAAQTTATNKNFTIETWIYPTTISYPNTFGVICVKRGSTAQATGLVWSVNTSGALAFAAGDSDTGSYNLSLSSSNGAIAANNWYHVAVTRQGTVYRMFINGTQVATSTPTAFVIAYDITGPLLIGLNAGESPAYPWYGYMQDFRYTIGAARYQGDFVVPTAAFAYNQSDINNQQWTPTNISVTAGIGQDNLADSPSDYGTDTGLGGQVRGNYATWNPLSGIANGTLSNGSLDFVGVANGSSLRHSTMGIVSGKWYTEIRVNSALSSAANLGVALYSLSAIGTVNASQSRGYYYDGQKYTNGTLSAYGSSFTNGDIIGIAVDADSGKIWFSKNGVFQASGDPAAGTNAAFTDITSNTWFISVQTGGSTGSASCSINFGQRAFSYAAPTGFKCLVSTNLPTPTIGATSTTQADNYFEAVTYTGNGTTQSVLLPGAGFTPDFTWIKSRSVATEWHVLCDSLRGPNKLIYSNSDLGEATVTNVLNSFDSGGFSVGYNAAYTSARVNTNAATYVGWAWRGGGSTGVTNNDGSITSTISASTTSGFSVVRYTGTGANGTIGHGLGKQLKYIMVKEMSNTDSWLVWHIALSGTQYLVLNSAAAAATLATVWNSTVPSSSAPYVFSVGTNTAINQSGQQYVAYCFTDISSFSSMGSYTGNGSSTQGPMIYTGFRPEFVYIKATANAFGGVMYDAARNPRNLTTQLLIPSNADAEITGVGDSLDFLSNGFITRNAGQELNQSSVPYLYLAIAEFPFKYARAR